MKFNVILGVIVSVSMISGCASSYTPPKTWQKSNTSRMEIGNAKEACTYDMIKANIVKEHRTRAFKACMRSKGFRNEY